MKSLLTTKKGRYILLAVFVSVIILGFGTHRVLSYKSPEYIKNELQVKQAIGIGWPIKHMASVEKNQDKIDEFRKQLPEHYSNDQGELSKQQRLITLDLGKTFDKEAVPEIYTKYYVDENEAVIDFRVSEFKFTNINIKKDRATAEAIVEYFIKRRMLSQEYGAIASETYQWALVKSKDKWLIKKESLIVKDNDKQR